MAVAGSSLDTIDLGGYITREIIPHKLFNFDYSNWQAANTLVWLILVTNMMEEIVVQVLHLKMATNIWNGAKYLFSGQTIMDFMLTITLLITMKYVDGKYIPTHLAKMRGFQHKLTLMGKDLNDELFGCFLRISMPSTWNYIFASLPNNYMSAKVE